MGGGRLRSGAYDEVLGDAMPVGLRIVALVFGAFALWHPSALPGTPGLVMAGLAGGTALLAGLLSELCRRGRVPRGRAHPVAAAVVLLALTQCAVQYAMTEQQFLVVNVLLVVVGAGICLVDPRWVAATVAGSLAIWVSAVGLTSGLAALLATLPNCALAVGVAALANTTRTSALRRLLDTQAELQALSQRDDLTGLLNRRGFLAAAQAMLDRGRPVRVWFVDVNGLKRVNDVHGHDVGDLLLVAVGTALAEVFSAGVVARLAGDEFAVVEPHTGTGGEGVARGRLHARLALAEQALRMPVSVSAGSATSGRGQDLSALLTAADGAMYLEKTGRQIVLPEPRGRSTTRLP
jgi:diguanylate cyclase (GGDEF)-like protein